ncbi:MAG: nuclear transport factor 2 family protein [Myxococcota bacterium]
MTSANPPQTLQASAQAFYARLASGDLASFFELLADDVEAVAPGSRAHIPWSGTWHGKDGFQQLMAGLGEVAQIEMYEPQRFVAEDSERIIVLGRERLRSLKTGRVAETSWVHELTFRNGRLCRFVEHYDTDALAVALIE